MSTSTSRELSQSRTTWVTGSNSRVCTIGWSMKDAEVLDGMWAYVYLDDVLASQCQWIDWTHHTTSRLLAGSKCEYFRKQRNDHNCYSLRDKQKCASISGAWSWIENTNGYTISRKTVRSYRGPTIYVVEVAFHQFYWSCLEWSARLRPLKLEHGDKFWR